MQVVLLEVFIDYVLNILFLNFVQDITTQITNILC